MVVNMVSHFIQGISVAPLQVQYYSEAHPTQHRYCVGVSKATQATASEGLAQGPYVAARPGFEPETLRTKGAESTKEPPSLYVLQQCHFL